MSVTIKDLAKEAGVSQGTVSNVLNASGKVSSTKIKLVEDAIKKLGYKTNAQAQRLKSGGKPQIAVLLPTLEIKKYLSFFESLRECMFDFGADVLLYLTDDIPTKEIECLKRIYSSLPSFLVSVSCLTSSSIYDPSVPTLFIDRFFPNENNVGFSYYQAGVDVANIIKSKKVALISSLTKESKDFISGLSSGSFEIREYNSDFKLSKGKALSLISEVDEFDTIVATDYERAQAIKEVYSYSTKEKFPKIICISDTNIFLSNTFTHYKMDYRKLGSTVAKIIQKNEQSKDQKNTRILANDGFSKPLCFVEQQKELNMLTLESPASDTLKRMLPSFEKASGIKVNLTVLSFEDLFDTIQSPILSSYYDLIRIDMAWLPQAGENLFTPLDDDISFYNSISSRFLPCFEKDYSLINGIPYAFPFDPSIQLLFYNKDVFDNPTVKRIFFEQNKSNLQIPQNYKEFDSLSRFFTREFNPESPTNFGTALAYGGASLAACDFLPRIWDACPKALSESEKLIINSSQIVQQLKDYVFSKKYSDKKIHKWWDDEIGSFINGDCAMIRVFMNHASPMINSKYSKIVGRIGCTFSPGATPMLGGGVIGIAKDSKNKTASKDFLRWIFSEDISLKFSFFGGLSPNSIIYENSQLIQLYPWIPVAKKGFEKGRRCLSPNTKKPFSERKFENIIGVAVRNAMFGLVPAEEALNIAQSQIEKDFY